jgi:hypothetical protein
MLTKGDDYPIHQTAEPVAVAGTDRNFYDRYFFNAQAPDGSAMLGAAMGIYPHLNVIDAAVSLTDGAVQRSVFGSRILGHERMDTHAGPVTVTVEEPLQRLRLTIAPSESGISGDIVFTGRAAPIEEPRFTRRQGSRTLMDVTRLTQGIEANGWIEAGGVRREVAGWRGVRDRSWGVRPIGAPDAQPVVPMQAPQFFWLWTPIAFDDWLLFFHTNDDEHGRPWNRSAVLAPVGGGEPMHLVEPAMAVTWRKGSRHAEGARLTARTPDGQPVAVEFDFGPNFLMRGIGYGHPTRGHGVFQGPDVTAGEDFVLADADPGIPLNAHIQAQVAARMTIGGGAALPGRGVFEQLVIGPHAPSGFAGLFDLA